jgi:hypothetical protein
VKSVLPAFSTPHLNQQNQAHAPKDTLVIRGFIIGTINGLSSAFFAGKSDFAGYIVLTPEKGIALAQPDFDYSSYIFNTLLETRRPPAVGIPPPLIKLWSSTIRTELGLLFDGYRSPTELEKLSDWFDDNRSLAAFGSTMDYWDSTWTSQPSDKDWSQQQTTCLDSLFRTIMSSMRIAILETGELGWVYPQSRKGDKIAKISGCDRHIVLRPHSRDYRVIGEARIYWLAGEPELSDKIESLTIF